jgi:hypothetical protein
MDTPSLKQHAPHMLRLSIRTALTAKLPPEPIKVGSFTVSRVDANGDIKAGCHFIQWREIAAIALKLGMAV